MINTLLIQLFCYVRSAEKEMIIVDKSFSRVNENIL